MPGNRSHLNAHRISLIALCAGSSPHCDWRCSFGCKKSYNSHRWGKGEGKPECEWLIDWLIAFIILWSIDLCGLFPLGLGSFAPCISLHVWRVAPGWIWTWLVCRKLNQGLPVVPLIPRELSGRDTWVSSWSSSRETVRTSSDHNWKSSTPETHRSPITPYYEKPEDPETHRGVWGPWNHWGLAEGETVTWIFGCHQWHTQRICPS